MTPLHFSRCFFKRVTSPCNSCLHTLQIALLPDFPRTIFFRKYCQISSPFRPDISIWGTYFALEPFNNTTKNEEKVRMPPTRVIITDVYYFDENCKLYTRISITVGNLLIWLLNLKRIRSLFAFFFFLFS
jgi:hypothetical protein